MKKLHNKRVKSHYNCKKLIPKVNKKFLIWKMLFYVNKDGVYYAVFRTRLDDMATEYSTAKFDL